MTLGKQDLIVIQCATPQEFESLRQSFAAQKIYEKKYFLVEELGVLVFRGGVGSKSAAFSAQMLCEKWNPGLVIDYGTAGGLAPGFHLGDVLLVDQVKDVGSGELNLCTFEAMPEGIEVPSFPQFLSLSEFGIRVTRGTLAVADETIEKKEDRLALGQKTGAVAVAWEATAIANVCKNFGVSFSSVRVVSDLGGLPLEQEYLANAATVLKPAGKLITHYQKMRRRKSFSQTRNKYQE